MEQDEGINSPNSSPDESASSSTLLNDAHAVSPTGFVVIDDSAVIETVSDSVCHWMGLSPEDLVGRDFLSLLDSHSQPPFREALDRVPAENRVSIRVDLEVKSQSMGSCEVTLVASAGQKSTRRLFLVLARDLEGPQSPEQPGSRESLAGMVQDPVFLTLSDFVYDCQVWLDSDGQLLFVNSAVQRLTGYSVQECLDKEDFPLNLIDSRDKQRVAKAFEGAQIGTSGNDVEFRIRRKDGSSCWVAASWQPILTADGSLIGHHASIRDVSRRKVAEASVIASQKRLETLMSNLPGMAYRCRNQPGRPLIFVSDGCSGLTGYSPDDLTQKGGRKWNDLIHPDDQNAVMDLVQRAVSSDEPYQVQYRILDSRGREKWVWDQGCVVDRIATSPGALEGFVTDISRQVTAEEQVRQSEERFRSIVNSSPMGMHLYRLEAKDRLVFIGANPAADEILGVPNERFVGQTIEEAFPPLKETEVPDRYRDVVRTGRSWRTEQINYEHEDISGAYEVVAFKTSKDTLAVMFLDITERIRADATIRESEARYRSLIEDQTEFIVRWRPDGTLTFVNDNYCRYFGLSHEEALSGTIYDQMPPDAATALKEHVQTLTPDSPVVTTEYSVRRPDSELAWNLWTDRALFDDDGVLIEIQSVGRDVTLRREAEEALRKNESAIRAIFRSAPVGISVVRDRKILRVNDRFSEITGYSQMDLLGQSTRLLFDSDADFELVGQALYEGIEEQGTGSIETRMRRKDGTIIDVLARGTVIDSSLSLIHI